MFDVAHVSVSVRRSPREVYAFASNGANLPRWASGLGNAIERSGEDWIAEGPLGRVTIRFAPANDLGVLDHDVTLPSGETVHNAMRVVPNGGGSEVTFTLFRLPGVSEAKFAEDKGWVERDLNTLKSLLE
jgi:hypothetical protein